MTAHHFAKNALKANKDHQYALKVYTERLEAELEAVDKLIASVEAIEEGVNPPVLNASDLIVVPGTVKPISVVPPNTLLSEDSPFFIDAQWRERYDKFTTINPMKSKEHDALASAVRTENYRMHALEAQRRGESYIPGLNDFPKNHFEMNKEGIDWEHVAMQVTPFSGGPKRSAKECEIRWLGAQHPEINHAAWTTEEVDRLKIIIANKSAALIDWVAVAMELGTNHTPIDCMSQGVGRQTHTWDIASDQKLLEAVRLYGLNNWNLVARTVSEDATGHQCQKRYQDTVDPNIKRGAWSSEEDEQLRLAVDAFGTSWQDIAPFIPGRTTNQCRERYQDRLKPKAKGKWSGDEDTALLAAVAELGEFNWKQISERLSIGRSDKMCRRRFEIIRTQEAKKSAGQMIQSTIAGPSHSGSLIADANTDRGERESSTYLTVAPKRGRKRKQQPTETEDKLLSGDSVSQSKPPRPRPRPRMRNAQIMISIQQSPNARPEGDTEEDNYARGAHMDGSNQNTENPDESTYRTRQGAASLITDTGSDFPNPSEEQQASSSRTDSALPDVNSTPPVSPGTSSVSRSVPKRVLPSPQAGGLNKRRRKACEVAKEADAPSSLLTSVGEECGEPTPEGASEPRGKLPKSSKAATQQKGSRGYKKKPTMAEQRTSVISNDPFHADSETMAVQEQPPNPTSSRAVKSRESTQTTGDGHKQLTRPISRKGPSEHSLGDEVHRKASFRPESNMAFAITRESLVNSDGASELLARDGIQVQRRKSARLMKSQGGIS